MKARQSQTLPLRIRQRALALAPLLLCLLVAQARAEDDPEPPRPKGELVELFAKLQDKDYNVVGKAKNELYQRVKPGDVRLLAWMARRGRLEERRYAFFRQFSLIPTGWAPVNRLQQEAVGALASWAGARGG